MKDEEKWEAWRNANAEIQKPYKESVHKHIIWYQGVDRRKAFLDGLAEGRKELEKELGWITDIDNYVATKLERCNELEKENAELKKDKEWLDNTNNEQTKVILKLQEQIEKMKDCRNCKHYGNYKDDFMCTLVGQKIHCKNKDRWELSE